MFMAGSPFLRKNKYWFLLAALLLLVSGIFLFSGAGAHDDELSYKVKRSNFEISVFCTGELEAKNSVSIDGPTGLRQFGIWQIKIADLIPEGTVVKKGDYVAALDKSEVSTKIKDTETELDKIQSQFTQTRLDTTLTLRQARDELLNLEFELQQKQIVLEQSAYEPPATIRQAKLDLEKGERSLAQAKKNYKVKEAQSSAKMQEVNASLMQTQRKLEQMNQILDELSITAPESGMVIYERDWNGKKKTVGDMVGVWEPSVAKLPDLSQMITRTYVNEVDIQKVKTGQEVNVSLDAFPQKRLRGKVTQVANVGEQNPRSDAKVFEVVIEMLDRDTLLKPSMTTGNHIIVGRVPNVLSVPLEAVFHQGDSISFVYKKAGLGFEKQEVITGQANDNFIIIKEGLKDAEEVLLNPPAEEKPKEINRLKKKAPVSVTAKK
jgi:hypothetical protein